MFRVNQKIPRRWAHEMIILMGKLGNHNYDLGGHLKTDADIKRHYAQNNYDFEVEVQRCRTFTENIMIYENLIGSQWTTKGVKVSRVNPTTGQEETLVEGDGVYNDKDYWHSFELAVSDLDEAISKSSYGKFLSAINNGIASIEAFFNYEYLHKMKEGVQPAELEISLDAKVDNWPERFTGIKLDKSKIFWNHFRELKNLRNNKFQHIKSSATGKTFIAMEREFNMFRTGIAQFLLELHVIYKERCPSKIIRYSYFPDITYVPDTDMA